MYDCCKSKDSFYLVQLKQTTNMNLEILQQNLFYLLFVLLRHWKVLLIFVAYLIILAFYGEFWSQLKLLPWKKPQEVKKKIFVEKNSRFVLVVWMSWTTYFSQKLLMHLSYHQTHEPFIFLSLKIRIFMIFKAALTSLLALAVKLEDILNL